MAQQSKITSRPLTKALGTASILSVAIAGANMANAIQTDFGVTYQADAFYVDGDAYGDDGSGNGLANLLRLKADFKDENTGVSLHTSIQLAGDVWTGDAREDGGPSYNNQGNESVTLDTGYVQIPVSGNLLRVGRQATSWNNCLLVCDDRRDRVGMVFPTAAGTFVTNYDRRADNIAGNTIFNSADSGDMFAGAYLTRLGGWNAGVLYVHFFKNTGNAGYTFQGAHIVSPYISGSLTEGLDLATGFNWVGGNEMNNEASAFGDEGGFGDGWSGYVRASGNAGALEYGVQYLGAIDGGLIDPGYDTYISVLNSNPSSTQSPTSLVNMGRGFGSEDYDEHLISAKLGFNVTPNLKLTGALGYLEVDNGTTDDSSMLYDVSASYQINSAVTTVASLGMMDENEAMAAGTAGNTLIGSPTVGGGLGTGDDLMAANVGIRVKF